MEDTLSRYTGGDYPAVYPDWHDSYAPWKAAKVEQILSRNPFPIDSIVEVGCGAGGLVDLLSRARRGVPCIGYDISPVAIDLAKKKTKTNLSFVNGNPFETEQTYDLAIALDVLEHVEDYFSFLRSMRKLGRRQVYHIPLELTVQALLFGNSMMKGREQSGHIHYFYKDTAVATLEDTGHHIVDWFYTAGAIEVPGDSLKRKIAAVPRRLAYGVSQDWAARVLGGFSMMVLCD
jgi:ubiquinone/menaquinone biosynthesis C-methylase UbiE